MSAESASHRLAQSSMKRLGLIGVGAWGRRFIQTIARRSDASIVAYARTLASEEPSLAHARRVSTASELFELARRGELDGLLVATNPQHQAEMGQLALERSLPAFVEKPLGLGSASLRPLFAARDSVARPAPLVVDYVHLFAPAFIELTRRVLEARAAGEHVVALEGHGHSRGPFRSTSSLYDYGPHDVSMCLALLGHSAEFHLERAELVAPADPTGQLFAAEFRLGECRVALRLGNGAEHKARRFSVRLSSGRELVYDDLLTHPLKLSDAGEPVPVANTLPLDASLGFFLELLETGSTASEHPALSLEFSLAVAHVLEAIESATR